MSKGINKVILIGNLGADPEVRATAAGATVANVSLATTDSWRDKQSGEKQDRTEWHRLVFFGKLGEIAGEYLQKGAKIYVEGRIQTRKWQGQDGQDRYTTEIVANEMQMLDGRSGGSAEASDQAPAQAQRPQQRPQPQAQRPQQRPQAQAQRPQQAQQAQQAQAQPPAPEYDAGYDGYDPDIPF